MKTILTLIMLASLTTLNGCELAKYSDKPTNESNSDIVEEVPYYQGESDHRAEAINAEGRCALTGCSYAECNAVRLDDKYCRFYPKNDCNQLIDCDENEKKCIWKRFPEYDQCIEKIEEEIYETNQRLKESLGKCDYNESCKVEFQFRNDHFDLVLPPHKRISFSGDEISIWDETEDGEPNGLDITIYIYEGTEGGIYDVETDRWDFEHEKKKGFVGNVPVITYLDKNLKLGPASDPIECTNYAFLYNGKTYTLYGHEGCYEKMSREIIEKIDFRK